MKQKKQLASSVAGINTQHALVDFIHGEGTLRIYYVGG
jgi:hypothetical protein